MMLNKNGELHQRRGKIETQRRREERAILSREAKEQHPVTAILVREQRSNSRTRIAAMRSLFFASCEKKISPPDSFSLLCVSASPSSLCADEIRSCIRVVGGVDLSYATIPRKSFKSCFFMNAK